MSWRQRARDLVLAGGSLALSGCFQSCCNANPDPCCGAPESQQCKVEKGCLENNQSYGPVLDDGGVYRYMCIGLDAAVPDLEPPPDLSLPRDLSSEHD